MGLLNLRSLLLAAIVLSNCITWTASRHHYTHNVNGHRSRHRRQGAGLYLSASYVLPGGEGTGAWGEWGEVSPCSRTCGGGVASQKRICLEIGPDGRPSCTGGDTKYFSCQTQDCPAGSRDFRSEQCSEFDNVAFKGIKYRWIPYLNGPNPCELNCMPQGERFYYRQKTKVTDGTLCNDESLDVCVNGTCQPVGCDRMLGSSAREDKCLVCRGTGANCHTVSGRLDRTDLIKGYNDMLLIPQGATSIRIAEMRDSNNYLALRAAHENATYYLNGYYKIDFPQSMMIAGAHWYYERNQRGFAAPDKLRSQGPTDEPLVLVLLLQDENVGIEYEYSIPSSLAPPADQQYNWVYDDFTPCSATCGGGFQFRNVTCRSREELEVVDEALCEAALRPPTNQTCGTDPCPAEWVKGPWGPCSKPCGEGGTRSRQVYCQKIITNGFPSIVGDKECFDLLGPKPELFQECNKNASCPKWFTGPWKPCDKLCGEGKQTRQVVCYQKTDGRVQVFDDAHCTDEKPAAEQSCILHPCDGVDWVLSDWSGCDSCLSTVRTRSAECATKDRRVVNATLCAYHTPPVLQEPCDRTLLPPCEVQWYATQWSNCSSDCGPGVQTRRVFCGLFDGASVLKVDDNRCANQTKYNETKSCEVPKEKCPAKWYAGPWSECTKMCGGGEQYRRVMCLRENKEVSDCDVDSILDSTQTCNMGPCNKDEMLPVDSTATPIIDEDYYDEECEEEEEGKYEEVGAEEDAFTDAFSPFEDMLSDSPSTLEGSGWTSFTETGSGDFTTDGSGWTEVSLSSADTDLTTESGETETTSSDMTSESGPTSESGATEETSESGPTSESGATEETSESGPTSESGATEETSESGPTSESGATDETTESGPTSESSATDETSESGPTSESGATDETTETGSTETTESGPTEETSESGSTDTTFSELSSSELSSESGSTEEATETGSTETSESSPTEETSETSSTEESTTSSDLSTDISSTSVSGSTFTDETTSESTDETSESSSTESNLTDLTSESSTIEDTGTTSETTESGVTTESEPSGSTETTESGITEESTVSGSTEISSTSESEITGSTEISTTEPTGSTETEETESTGTGSDVTESSTTELTSESTETSEFSTTEGTGSTETEETESTSEGSSTTEISTEESTTESGGSTLWDWTTTLQATTRKRMCKIKRSKCRSSKFGCCPDMRTPAAGPFDEGCPNPKTCKESKFGCCPDGVSPAAGEDNKGCPVPPCNETLFGCCLSDNVTAAEGNDQEGCPPMPPACKSSKYGCCKDEETEAKGPKKAGCPETEAKKKEEEKKKQEEKKKELEKLCAETEYGCCYDNITVAKAPDGQGCPCNATEFGCCPDAVTPAVAPGSEGCPTSCNSSAFGCCPDNKTPAHGYDYEGCCLLYPYGCCPDNFKPAEGPHLEGCGCQFARYGCCPDNVTIAHGAGNEGCGCQFSEHGCCPDRHTPASGPEYEGCGCHTYQFGCCDDGVRVAKGPNKLGCHCRDTEFGCCGDGKTPATGPEKAGCDCATSEFGCCPDGQTEAKGRKFLGCTDIPENRQAACSLSTDRGPCRNYSVYWYYDMEYGGCSRFWYGGCDGNGNRFASKEECEDVCVQPAPKDACKLPQVKGACVGYHLRWYYDSSRERCSQFVFGGCLGNANNFDSEELCKKQCEPERSADQCDLPLEPGPCAGSYPRWGFNKDSGRCEQFTWGGCEGNSNKFSTEAACRERCDPPGRAKPICQQPLAMGNCTEKLAMWAFSQTENRCVPFYYSGCGGNDNRFDYEQHCNEACPPTHVKDVCELPAEIGDCADYRQNWYYDTAQQRCLQFYYGGCGGNENNFPTQQQCESRCSEPLPTTTTARPVQQVPQTYTQEFCFLEVDPGPCTNFETRWAYDSARGACVTFEYGGCGGNSNNFPAEEYCQYYCKTTQDICQLPMMSGPCDDSQMKWFYDPASDTCSQFTYGGCEGNGNRFDTVEDCERRCRTGPAPTAAATTPAVTTTIAHVEEAVPPECRISPTTEECSEAGVVWYYEPNQRTCIAYENVASGAGCRRTGVFASEEACLRSCGVFRDIQVCRYPVDPGPCREAVPKFYYDEATGACLRFTYGGCHGGPNRFSTIDECEQICRSRSDPCTQPQEPGNCVYSYPMWYYDRDSDQCAQFVYSGCNGNENRFNSREECEGVCRSQPPATTTTTLATPVATPPQLLDEACTTPPSLRPCGENVTAYYYDAASGSCLSSGNGNCRYRNTYRTEEECERRCGAFRDVDVCRYPLDVGPCKESIPKFYFELSTGRCEPFAYSGCGGGPNRFSTIDECQELCGPVGPDTSQNEVLPDCSRYNEECGRLRCEFGVQRTRTHDGCERCSCIQVEVDCSPLQQECQQLKCTYGVEKTLGDDGCERCRCIEHPCASKECPSGERCVASAYRDPITQDTRYSADCKIVNKPGMCPSEAYGATESQCRRECNDDADCRGVGKCCARGCSFLCLEPATATSPAPRTTTYTPELPQKPQANPDTEPEVQAQEGGKATLRCLFHGNPPPKITWRRGEITIDGSVGRYRLLSDGALEIVSLYRNDSGVYICVAENLYGTSRQEIRLQINDPVEMPAGISGEPNAVVTGEFGRSLTVRCLAYGHPEPTILWYRGGTDTLVPFRSSLYETRGNIMLIRKLDLDTIGEYTCEAYNGIDRPASWSIVVQAYRPDESYQYPFTVARDNVVLVTQRTSPPETTTTTILPEITVPVYTVPVRTRISVESTTLAAGSELNLPCEVDGYPVPNVYWTKDGSTLSPNQRTQITEARLTISALTTNDSGVYGCHASNAYSSHFDTVQINVHGVYIPAKCTDNPFFANCHLIVRSKYCQHPYYSKFCCKSCMEAGQLNPEDVEYQADETWKK